MQYIYALRRARQKLFKASSNERDSLKFSGFTASFENFSPQKGVIQKLKKLHSLFLVTLVLLRIFPLISCASNLPSAIQLCLEIDSLFKEEDRGCVLYTTQISESDKATATVEPQTITPEIIGRLYTGKYSAPTSCDRISSCAVRLPVDESGFEIHVLIALNLSDVTALSSLLNARIEKMHSDELMLYAPEEYLRNYRNAELFISGRYVILLATPDNEKAKASIKALL